jgi:small subunit ribosomal protein S8e
MRIGRKATGGRYKRPKKKKSTGRQGQTRIVKLGDIKRRFIDSRGNAKKHVLIAGNVCNVVVNGKTQKTKITNVIETPSNVFLARQNVLVKGAIINTELGKAKITNRPSQEGQIQAVLVE